MIYLLTTVFSETTALIFCNQCNQENTVKYHFIENKCPNCQTYNTTVNNIANRPGLTIAIFSLLSMVFKPITKKIIKKTCSKVKPILRNLVWFIGNLG